VIGTAKVLALITARGGSKGVPRKNVRLVWGRPLITWTIAAAKKSALIDRLVLSTDDAEIAAVARAHGCEVPFMRPAELATDNAASLEVVRHAVTAVGMHFDYILLLQPTSPLRTSADIDACITMCVERRATSCVSVCEVDKTPYWMFTLTSQQQLVPLLPAASVPQSRQAAPKVFVLNGAVFVARTDHIMAGGTFIADDTVAYEMRRERSIDLDTEEDFAMLELRAHVDHD